MFFPPICFIWCPSNQCYKTTFDGHCVEILECNINLVNSNVDFDVFYAFISSNHLWIPPTPRNISQSFQIWFSVGSNVFWYGKHTMFLSIYFALFHSCICIILIKETRLSLRMSTFQKRQFYTGSVLVHPIQPSAYRSVEYTRNFLNFIFCARLPPYILCPDTRKCLFTMQIWFRTIFLAKIILFILCAHCDFLTMQIAVNLFTQS